MRITIATGPLLPVPALDGGAVQRMWHGLAEAFAAKGHQVVVLAKADRRQRQTEIVNHVLYLRHGGYRQTLSIVRDLSLNLLYSLSVLRKLPSADVLVTNDFWLPTIVPWLRRNAGSVVVNAARFPKHQYGLYRHVGAVVAVSKAVTDAIRAQTSAIEERVHTIPMAFDARLFAMGEKALDVRGEPLKVLYAGRIHPEKGLHQLIAAVRIASASGARIELTIIGPYREDQGGGGEGYRLALQKQATGSPIRWLEPEFEVARLINVYQGHSIFCYPSIAENGESFGLAPVEAMACGLIPIVSGLDCFNDFITDGTTGFRFDHRADNAAEQIAAILIRLYREPEIHQPLICKAQERAWKYDYKAVADQYLELFKELVES